MKTLKTIVVTVVIVLSLTTVALAGARHFAAGGAAAAITPAATPAVTLTDAQLQQLVHDLTATRDRDVAADRDRIQHRGSSATTARHATRHMRQSAASHTQSRIADVRHTPARLTLQQHEGRTATAGGHHRDAWSVSPHHGGTQDGGYE